jgi:hypothetical protein
MYEKLDMNYGRVLYESGKREVERIRENKREINIFICETIFFYCSSLLDLNSQTAQNMKY